MDSIRATCEGKGNEIVFADALQNEKHSGGVTRIGNKVRPRGRDRKGLAWRQSHVFLGVLQKDADRSNQHIECVMDVGVIVPRHLLGGTDLQLGYAKARARGVNSTALDFVEGARILQLHVRPPWPASSFYVSSSCLERSYHSGLAPESLTTLAHFSLSSTISLPKSVGEPARTVPPKSARRTFILGSESTALISLLGADITAGACLFSMMNGWPRRSDSDWPIRRATMSFAPPAAKATINAPAVLDRL